MNPNENLMRKIRIEKITVNMGVGEAGDALERAQTIMEKITGAKAVQTKAKIRLPTWEIRPGLPIGVKVTLRKQKALEFLKRALSARDNELNSRVFDNRGNFGFGVKEYIDLPGVKYDPKLGVRGFDVLVTLERPGYRIKRRKLKPAGIGKKHAIAKQDAMDFLSGQFGVKFEEK
ncbi:MAG: 50S ribosomal protein L5 [Candidatus Micrarchaeota archaeon]